MVGFVEPLDYLGFRRHRDAVDSNDPVTHIELITCEPSPVEGLHANVSVRTTRRDAPSRIFGRPEQRDLFQAHGVPDPAGVFRALRELRTCAARHLPAQPVV